MGAPLLHVPTKDGVLPPDMKYGGVPHTRRFFTDSFYTEEAEIEVRFFSEFFLLILTPFPANFA